MLHSTSDQRKGSQLWALSFIFERRDIMKTLFGTSMVLLGGVLFAGTFVIGFGLGLVMAEDRGFQDYRRRKHGIRYSDIKTWDDYKRQYTKVNFENEEEFNDGNAEGSET
jgi:hypothetical protein